MKQQSSELAEQLKLKASENSTLGLELHELRKRLEMADVMLQQVTPHGHVNSCKALFSF